MTQTAVGTLVRDWRQRRSRSQLDVAYDIGVSPRHLSFVETGRSRPSPELIDAIGVHLDIPLRERNTLLLAAGFAPRYQHTSLADPEMAGIVESLRRLLDAHGPYPGVVLDRHWNVVELRERIHWTTSTCTPDLLVSYRLELGGTELSMFTTLTTFGTPRDITLDELAVELFFPNDTATADHFRQAADEDRNR